MFRVGDIDLIPAHDFAGATLAEEGFHAHVEPVHQASRSNHEFDDVEVVAMLFAVELFEPPNRPVVPGDDHAAQEPVEIHFVRVHRVAPGNRPSSARSFLSTFAAGVSPNARSTFTCEVTPRIW